tara:strand:+ start:222 stop:419 length:198 start_codon:yes stop_codon:yes gene_type:complete
MKINKGINIYKETEIFELVEYLNEASDRTNIKKVRVKIIFLYFLCLKLFFGKIIKKQLKIAIKGI